MPLLDVSHPVSAIPAILYATIICETSDLDLVSTPIHLRCHIYFDVGMLFEDRLLFGLVSGLDLKKFDNCCCQCFFDRCTTFHFETITLHEASLSPQHLNVVGASDSSLRSSGPKELISLAPDHHAALNRCTSIYLLVAGCSPPAYKATVLSLHLFVPITPHIDSPSNELLKNSMSNPNPNVAGACYPLLTLSLLKFLPSCSRASYACCLVCSHCCGGCQVPYGTQTWREHSCHRLSFDGCALPFLWTSS
jgi:hypothetical protein